MTYSIFRVAQVLLSIDDNNQGKRRLISAVRAQEREFKMDRMKPQTTASLIIAGLLISGCGGGTDNVCAIASQHVVSCIPGKKAVNPTCDTSAAERANMVLGMSCVQIQALAKSGKADWGWCWSFWDCGDSNTDEPTYYADHCTDHSECASGWCDPVNKVCSYRSHLGNLSNGEQCFNDHECVSSFCHPETKICTEQGVKKLGDSCVDWLECGGIGHCVGNTCLGFIGSNCSGDYQCISMYCDPASNTCQSKNEQ